MDCGKGRLIPQYVEWKVAGERLSSGNPLPLFPGDHPEGRGAGLDISWGYTPGVFAESE